MLTGLSAFATKQANPTAMTMEKTKQFLDYAASKSNAKLTYNASKMVLGVYSNASYLNKKQAQAEQGGISLFQPLMFSPQTVVWSSTQPK